MLLVSHKFVLRKAMKMVHQTMCLTAKRIMAMRSSRLTLMYMVFMTLLNVDMLMRMSTITMPWTMAMTVFMMMALLMWYEMQN